MKIYLYSISKKKLGMELIFLHTNKHQSFYKLALLFLMKVARHVQSTLNRKFLIFLQYIKKKVLHFLLCSIVMQNIQMFYRSPVMIVVTCYFYLLFLRVTAPVRSLNTNTMTWYWCHDMTWHSSFVVSWVLISSLYPQCLILSCEVYLIWLEKCISLYMRFFCEPSQGIYKFFSYNTVQSRCS